MPKKRVPSPNDVETIEQIVFVSYFSKRFDAIFTYDESLFDTHIVLHGFEISLAPHITAWVTETSAKLIWSRCFGSFAAVAFDNPTDALLFKIRWL